MTNQLIPVFTGVINKEEIKLVNARELHQFLEVNTQFKDWINRRISEYQFIENTDFILVAQKRAINSRGGDRRSKDYHLSLDMAKELSMVERTEKGRQARKYFIECEKKLRDNETQKTNPPSATLPALAPVEPTEAKIETVKFYEHEIDVIFYEEKPYLIVKQISDNIGINYNTSRDQIQKRNDINHTLKYIKLPTNGGTQRYLCLPLAMLNVWLQKLVPSRTKVGDMLMRYQFECFNFLFDHFAQNGYKKISPVMTNNVIDSPKYEKMTPTQMRELTQKVHEISNQFHFSRTANAAIWFAIRYVTGTPSPEDFDIRHIPIIVNECNRINAILTKYTHIAKQNERLIISHAIRKRESIDDILSTADSEIKSLLNLTDEELINSVKPCHKLTSINILS